MNVPSEIVAKCSGEGKGPDTRLSRQVRAFLGRVSDVEEILLQGIRLPLVETLKTVRGLLKGVSVFFNVFTLPDGARHRKGR